MVDTNNDQPEEGAFTVTEAKAQQKRESIMSELYNDISSSDEEEGEAKSTEISSDNSASKSQAQAESYEEVKGNSITTSASFKKAEDNELLIPFAKKTESQANAALKELYGEDYEEPIGFEEAKTSEQQLKLKDRLTA